MYTYTCTHTYTYTNHHLMIYQIIIMHIVPNIDNPRKSKTPWEESKAMWLREA